MTWIVLEGAYGSGKTTLARSISDRLGWTYEHVDVDTGAYPFLASWWREYPRGNCVVWDRGFLGELVFGPARGHDPTVGEVRLMEALMRDQDGMMVLVDTDPVECWRRAPGRHGIGFGEYARQAVAFNSLVDHDDRTSCKTWRLSDLGNFVERLEDQRSRWKFELSSDDEGVGTHRPDIWLLGEQRNPRAPVKVPFCTRVGLDLVWPWVRPSHVRVSNALYPDGSTRLYERWSSLGEPHVVCLGKVAASRCRAERVPVMAAMPHPNYWARFFSTKVDNYASELAMTLTVLGPKAEGVPFIAVTLP